VTTWHILTGEFPPQPGGVSDYTHAVARGLAASGDRVTVWAPPSGVSPETASPALDGVAVRRLPDRFGLNALRELDRELDRGRGPHRLLVQYVPHAFGWKALNVPFCLWLRSRRRDSIWVMFHEVAFPIDRRQRLARNLVGVVTRRMASIVAGVAERAYVSIPAWEPVLRELTSSPLPIHWLPVPSTIPVVRDPSAIAQVRLRLTASREPLVGHFGTYGALIRPQLDNALTALLSASNDARVLLLGRGSDRAAADFLQAHPEARGRVTGAGDLPPRDVSVHLSACDVLMQPYPDGISGRRTSAMAGLSHARPVVTTGGPLTEAIWRQPTGVVLCPAEEPGEMARQTLALLGDRARRLRLSEEARAVYDARFDIRHTIAALRAPARGDVELGAAS